jgi:large repetitive protein
MRIVSLSLLVLGLSGCGSTWTGLDSDGDGYTLASGDCDDGPDGAGAHPGAEELWYDGIDQNCDGADDYDQDGDGERAVGFEGGTDCWDDPTSTPPDFVALNGFAQPGAADVFTSADEVWYDGVDQDCGGDDDFDQDGDGYASTAWAETRTTLPIEDCLDAVTEVYPESWAECVAEALRVIATPLSPAAIHPGATDTWYDGTDANCDGGDDFDLDGDGYAACEECDDENAAIFPNDSEEIWYNHVDENCDGNDADQDGDGYLTAGYVEADSGDPIHLPGAYGTGDCWDAPDSIPSGYDAISGKPQPAAESVHPDATETWYDGVDQDCAGDDDFDQDDDGDPSDSQRDRTGGVGHDCNDTDGTINSDAAETWYDGVDQNCDGASDYDQDRDGYDSSDYSYGTADDCDDTKASVHPSEPGDEVNEDCATPYDDDCDGNLNDEDADSCIAYYDDADLDGYGDINDTRCICTAEGTYTETGVTSSNDDCDDTRSAVNPGVANESCSTTYDDDCDGVTNEQNGTACTTYYLDADGDGYGTTSSECWCSGHGTYDVTDNTDCDDSRAAVNPGVAKESCATTYDDDCDGVTNEQNGTSCTTYYYDSDSDGWGDSSKSQCWCAASGTYNVTVGTDCVDSDAKTYPGVASKDSTTACMTDADGDKYGSTTAPAGGTAGTDCDDSKSGVKPGATETCGTAYDDDCDGDVNDIGATGCTTYYYDGDNDGYGKSSLSQCTCSTSGSYDVTNSTDCDDADADTFPGAASNDSTTSCMNDDDGDDYGDKTVTGTVVAGTDCDDTKSAVSPAATETCSTTYDDDCDGSANDVGATGCTTYYYDADSDGYGLFGTSQCTCNASGSYKVTGTTAATTDCDDTKSGVYPGHAELCSTTYDDDCDGSTNDVGATGCTTYYYDADSDGYGISTSYQCTCTTSGFYSSTVSTDCDDTKAAVSPAATETCSTAYDDDCDSTINEVGATGCVSYYYDADADGYGLFATSQCACSASGYYTVTGTTAATTDCDDTRAAVYPGATETCSTTYDDDCDGSTNDVGATACTTYYYDADGDGYGLFATSQCTCTTSGSYTVTGTTAATTDCDDASSGVHPGATETCSTTYDDDCDGSTNDVGATGCTTYYYDGDGDGYGLSTTTQCTCSASGDYDTTDSTDCNDSSSSIHPGVADTFATNDGVDNDCDGYIDETGIAFGDIVITEFFGGNALATYDWFELYNNGGDTISLSSWTASLCAEASTTVTAPYTSAGCDSEVVVTFPTSATVAAGAYYVVCASTSGAIWTTPADCDLLLTDYDLPAYTAATDLENAVGGINIELDGTTIDDVYWWQESGSDDWPAYPTVAVSYASVQLDLGTINTVSPDPADANDDYSTDTSAPYAEDIWCLSDDAGVTNDWSFAYSMYGTPGTANVACP